jgi:hypothetical protein
MESEDRINLALRASTIAASILQLLRPINKGHARLIMAETIKLLTDLDQKIKSLPEN